MVTVLDGEHFVVEVHNPLIKLQDGLVFQLVIVCLFNELLDVLLIDDVLFVDVFGLEFTLGDVGAGLHEVVVFEVGLQEGD